MANADTPFGARLLGSFDQAMANGQIHTYVVPATDNVALFVGDFVKVTGTMAVGEDGLYHPVVAQAETTDRLTGFVVGFKVDPDNLNRIYRPASTLRVVYVMDAPYVRFEMQTSGVGAIADAGANADIVVGTGSPISGVSAMEIDQTTVGTGTQIRIVEMMQRPDNELGEFMKWVCIMNDHFYKDTTGI